LLVVIATQLNECCWLLLLLLLLLRLPLLLVNAMNAVCSLQCNECRL
jgi:hypothetical protein